MACGWIEVFASRGWVGSMNEVYSGLAKAKAIMDGRSDCSWTYSSEASSNWLRAHQVAQVVVNELFRMDGKRRLRNHPQKRVW